MRMELGWEILVWVSALGYWVFLLVFFLILTYMCTCMFTYVCSTGEGTKSDIGYLPQPLPNLFIEVGSCS